MAGDVLRVRVKRPEMLMSLVEALHRGECECTVVSDDTCEVVHRGARDRREALTELAFFLRAWCSERVDLCAELVC
jgi:hypothetical protein